MSFWYGENILFNNSTTDQSKFSLLILSSVHVMCTSMKVFRVGILTFHHVLCIRVDTL